MKKHPQLTASEEVPDQQKRRIAEELDQKVIRALESMTQREKDLIGILAELFGSPGERNRERVIWQGIVACTNVGKLDDPENRKLSLIYFKDLSWLCAWRLEGELTVPIGDLSIFRDVEFTAKQSGKSREEVFVEMAPSLQAQLRKTLYWLADPNSCEPHAKAKALQLLIENGAQSAIDFDIDPVDDFDKTGNRGYPLFYWKRIWGYATVACPIAKFIYDQLEQYHAGEMTLDEAVPIIVCKRPECGKFAVPRRRTKEFCSDSCRTLYRQKTKSKVHAAYMRKYRAENY
jgi:hypothetical protein